MLSGGHEDHSSKSPRRETVGAESCQVPRSSTYVRRIAASLSRLHSPPCPPVCPSVRLSDRLTNLVAARDVATSTSRQCSFIHRHAPRSRHVYMYINKNDSHPIGNDSLTKETTGQPSVVRDVVVIVDDDGGCGCTKAGISITSVGCC